MLRLNVMLLMTAFLISCKSEHHEIKSDLESANLKGKVFKVDRTFHDANGRSACPAAMKTECHKSVFIYNEKGNLIEVNNIDEDGDVDVTSKYIYNKRGLFAGVEKYREGQLIGRETPVHKNGKMTGLKLFNEKGIVENSFEYTYSGDELSNERTLSSDGEIVVDRVNEFQNGQIVSQTDRDNKGDVVNKVTFKRNSHNDIVEYHISVLKDNSEFVFTFEYEYDDKGNWIKQTQYYDGQIASIILRNIEYFEV